jgi:hypothetical protein
MSVVYNDGFQAYMKGIIHGRVQHWFSQTFKLLGGSSDFITHVPDSATMVLNSCAIY